MIPTSLIDVCVLEEVALVIPRNALNIRSSLSVYREDGATNLETSARWHTMVVYGGIMVVYPIKFGHFGTFSEHFIAQSCMQESHVK